MLFTSIILHHLWVCGYTTELNSVFNISSNVSLCSMTFCYSRKLPSKVPSARG